MEQPFLSVLSFLQLKNSPTCPLNQKIDMNRSYSFQPQQQLPTARISVMQRSSKRLTTTIPWAINERLQKRADDEGRSLSNLVAHLLEIASLP